MEKITGTENAYPSHLGDPGLTKREYFAAMAMQGHIAAGSTGMPLPSEIAVMARDAADMLIEALNNK